MSAISWVTGRVSDRPASTHADTLITALTADNR
jgi:hypothetical protein